jgi:hypothetical protein
MGADLAFDTLSRQLRSADDQTLLKIVSVVDRLARRGSLDQLLAEHRLRLAVIRPPRPMTVGRLFVLPFEELLIDAAEWSPGLMRVPRDRLARLIALTFESLPEGLEKAVRQRLEGRTMDDAALILEVGRDLWPGCAEAVRRTLERGRQSRDAEIRDLLLPLRIAEHLLPVAEAVVTTVWALPPKPMLELDEAAKEKLGDLLGRAAEVGKDSFQLVAELLVGRSELPLSVIEAVLSGAFDWGTRERQQAAALIAEACQSDMVRLYRNLAKAPPSAEPRELVPALQAIVSNLESLQELAAEVKFDHRALRRLKADTFELIKARLTVALDHSLFEAFEAIDNATESHDWRRLEQNAAAAANMRLMAKRIGLATKIDFVFSKAFERYRDSLGSAAHGMLAPMVSSPGPMLQPLAMDRLRIIELLFGSRPALQLLDQWRKAAADPHAARHRAPHGERTRIAL